MGDYPEQPGPKPVGPETGARGRHRVGAPRGRCVRAAAAATGCGEPAGTGGGGHRGWICARRAGGARMSKITPWARAQRGRRCGPHQSWGARLEHARTLKAPMRKASLANRSVLLFGLGPGGAHAETGARDAGEMVGAQPRAAGAATAAPCSGGGAAGLVTPPSRAGAAPSAAPPAAACPGPSEGPGPCRPLPGCAAPSAPT
jgi:hypothetical protein